MAEDPMGDVRPLRRVVPDDTATADDPWRTEDGSYSPFHFYVRSTDGTGASRSVRVGDRVVSVKPDLAGQIAALIEQRRIPQYRTSSDFFRDAAYHRLRFLSAEILTDDFELRAALDVYHLNAELEREMARQEHEAEYLENMRAGLERASGSRGNLAAVLELAETAMKSPALLIETKKELARLVNQYRGVE